VGPGEVIIGRRSHTCTYGAWGPLPPGWLHRPGRGHGHRECWFQGAGSIRLVYTGALPEWLTGKDLILHTIGDIGVGRARYLAMEFTGEAIAKLPMADRFSMANMAVKPGQNGIMAPDKVTLDYVKGRALRPYTTYESDPGQRISSRRPTRSAASNPRCLPVSPGNVVPVPGWDVPIDQAVIGSCTNGRLETCVWPPRSSKAAGRPKGCASSSSPPRPGLSPAMTRPDGHLHGCRGSGQPAHLRALLGGTGILAPGETAIATTNRNLWPHGAYAIQGLLASPAVAAASAVAGRIMSPKDL